MTDFTKAGLDLAKVEPIPPTDPLGGATAHMRACQYDTGRTILLTGKDFKGKPIRRQAKSVYGAFMTMKAVAGLRRAYDVDKEGHRTLIITRP